MSHSTTAYIETHELMAAYNALCCDGAGKAELAIFHEYDVDPLDPNAEDLIHEIIEDQCASEWADNSRKMEAA